MVMNGDAKKSAKSSPFITIHHQTSPNITIYHHAADAAEGSVLPTAARNVQQRHGQGVVTSTRLAARFAEHGHQSIVPARGDVFRCFG
jgi:hypothetical protein